MSASQRPTPVYESKEQELYLLLQRLTSAYDHDFFALFRAHGLTLQQFNILRILRGAAKRDPQHSGVATREIGTRLITHAPDITRLLDRMMAQGLVTRSRSGDDRRVVKVSITDKGLQVLGALDAPVAALHKQQFAEVPQGILEQIVDLLYRLENDPQRPAAHQEKRAKEE